MFNIGEYVVYRHDVCLIKEIKKGKDNKDYYVLIPITDETLKIQIPTYFENKSIRKLINKEAIMELIKKIHNIELIKIDNKLLENEYKKLLSDGTHESLIKIIKTTYLRNKERIDTKRKVSEKDDYYFKLAEKYLYNEFSVVLNKTYEETKEYIIKEIEKIIYKNIYMLD